MGGEGGEGVVGDDCCCSKIVVRQIFCQISGVSNYGANQWWFPDSNHQCMLRVVDVTRR